MTANYSDDRKARIGALNLGRTVSEEERDIIREAARLRYEKDPGLKGRISDVVLYR